MLPTVADMNSIQELHESSTRPLGAFIGSGLSIPDPTGLPYAQEVVFSLLNLDWVDGGEKFPVSKAQIEQSDLRKIRFEHLLSTFQEWGKHDIGLLLRQFGEAEPNWYHFRVAELCKSGMLNCIITTNFDSCLEKAITESEAKCNVIVTEADEYSSDPNVTNVFKIHGTIDCKGNSFVARGLGATLESLANGLQPWKRDLLLKLINEFTLVFLGYSGSDSYDINPALYSKGIPELCWVAHSRSEDDKYISPEVSRLLLKSKASTVVHMDSATFLGGRPLPPRERPFKFLLTYDLSAHWHPSVFVGRVFDSIQDYESGHNYYERVLEESNWIQYMTIEQLDLLRGNAVALYEMGRYKESEYYLFVAKMVLLDYSKKMESDAHTSKEMRARIYMDHFLLISEEEALVYSELGDHKKALDSMEDAFKALEVLRQLGWGERKVLSIESRLLLNRANVVLKKLSGGDEAVPGDYLILRRDLEKACESKRLVGDSPGLILALAMTGQICIQLSDGTAAFNIFLAMFVELQKLKSPFWKKGLEFAVAFVASLLYSIVVNDNPDVVRSFIRHKSSVKESLEFRIRSVLLEKSIENGGEAFDALQNDSSINDLLSQLEVKIIE